MRGGGRCGARSGCGSEAEIEGNAVKTRNMATLRGYAESACEEGERIVTFRFLVSPVEVVGEGDA